MPTSSDSNAAVAAGNVMQADVDNLVQRVAARIRSRFAEEASGHDWHHIHRVGRLARKIAVAEGARLDVVELAALVHDIADWKFHGGDDAVGPREAERLLREEGAGDDLVEPVVEIVATISFKGAGVRQPMRTLNGQCVQDADRLDVIGAIGIARCFAYGGKVKSLTSPGRGSRLPPLPRGLGGSHRRRAGGDGG